MSYSKSDGNLPILRQFLSMMFKQIKRKLATEYYWSKYRTALNAFNEAIPYRNFLPEEMFEGLVRKYASIPSGSKQDYSAEGIEKFSNERVDLIHKKVKGAGFKDSVMEIGAGTGHVLKAFKKSGFKRAVMIDVADIRTDDVKQAGVECILTSADDMSVVPDASFEIIISWNAMEHIPNPEKVFKECLRVLKPGGYMFWRSGHLYYSPWGYHHYAYTRVPYLQLLFPEKLIHDYAAVQGKFNGYIPWTNGCALEEYDFLKKPLPYGYTLESYHHGFDIYATDLIIKYPEIFKSKNVSFNNFFVDWIEVSLWKSN